MDSHDIAIYIMSRQIVIYGGDKYVNARTNARNI